MTAILAGVRSRLAAYTPEASALPQISDDIDHVDWSVRTALTPAAVLVPIVNRATPTVLLTKRNSRLRRHAGQVAFPGGRIDAGEDAVRAALREAEEETALPASRVEVLSAIDDYATGTGFRVTPVVGVIPPDLPLVPAEAEVEALFEVPLAHLVDPANHQKRSGEWRGRQRSYFVIAWQEHDIWGATAGMIVNLARILGPLA